jgi:hypothetical protein
MGRSCVGGPLTLVSGTDTMLLPPSTCLAPSEADGRRGTEILGRSDSSPVRPRDGGTNAFGGCPGRSLKTEEREPKASAGSTGRASARPELTVKAINQWWVGLLRRVHLLVSRDESSRLALRFSGGPSGPSEGLDGEFDPGSGRTLAACLTHASRTLSIR